MGMRVLKGVLAVALLAGSLSANAVPTTWVDTIDWNPDKTIDTHHPYTYTHYITDNGYTPFVDFVTGFHLSVNLYDDGGTRDGMETALVDVPSLPGLLGILEGADKRFFNVSGNEFGGWSIIGYLQLLLTGSYTVTIASLQGDFMLGDSTLTVWGEDNSRSVPEPATLSMLGLGLLGLGVFARRRRT